MVTTDVFRQALEAYARLTIYHAGSNELLCDAIARRESELVPALVVKVPEVIPLVMVSWGFP